MIGIRDLRRSCARRELRRSDVGREVQIVPTGIQEIPDTVRIPDNKYCNHGTHFHGERASGHRALRRARVSIPGQTCLVTFTTHQRTDIFSDAANAVCIAKSLHGLRVWKDARLLAWVVMPDHLHPLIALGTEESLSGVVQKTKSNTARALNARNHLVGQVWAPAFHDRALRRDEDLQDIARYLVLNPVRAGLVRRVGDYPFWDAVWV